MKAVATRATGVYDALRSGIRVPLDVPASLFQENNKLLEALSEEVKRLRAENKGTITGTITQLLLRRGEGAVTAKRPMQEGSRARGQRGKGKEWPLLFGLAPWHWSVAVHVRVRPWEHHLRLPHLLPLC